MDGRSWFGASSTSRGHWLPGSSDTLSVYYECCPRTPRLLLLDPEPRWQDTRELWIPRFSDSGGIALSEGEVVPWSPDPPASVDRADETEQAVPGGNDARGR